MLDLTKEWFAVVRNLRQQQQQQQTAGTSGHHRAAAGGYSSAAAAETIGSRWRTPLSPFMQQASELNYSIRDMHAFLRHHFLDYVDVHHCLPSKRSLMTEEDKNMIDLEVTSFMTACATGVDTLKALLQRERLRRMEQESAAARAAGEAAGQQGSVLDDGGLLGAGAAGTGSGGELRPGSRPAHEHAAVTFLFERLKAVTEVAETMQTERHARAAARKARFYAGPAESGTGVAGAAAAAAAAAAADSDGDNANEDRYGPLAYPSTEEVWTPTPEELEEERLLRESLPTAFGDSDSSADLPPAGEEDVVGGGGVLAGFSTAAAAAAAAADDDDDDAEPERRRKSATTTSTTSKPPSPSPTGVVGAGAPQQRPAAAEERRRARGAGRPGASASTTGAVRRRRTGQAGAEGEGGGGGSGGDVVSAAVLEMENRDLVARLKNELDDARLVENKMSEISGLMGLFASKVVEQQGGMEHVFDAAVSANDKLVRGGQHLEKAVQRGGAFRMFYAWFMIGASFCLLFLHFYNP